MKLHFKKSVDGFWYETRRRSPIIRICTEGIFRFFGVSNDNCVLIINRKNPKKSGFKKVVVRMMRLSKLLLDSYIDQLGRQRFSKQPLFLTASVCEFLWRTKNYFNMDNDGFITFWVKIV